MKRIVIALAFIAFAGTAANAQSRNINQRQATQDRRIDNGVRNGSLTRQESRQLRDKQIRIARLERQFKADGFLSVRERRILSQEQNELNRMIAFNKNDRDRRYYN